jgi:hypothetical protein
MKNEGALRMRFSRQGGIYRSDVFSLLVNPVQMPPPVGRPRYRAIGRAGRSHTPCPSSAMSSALAIPQRVARQHCPSPLHQQCQIKSFARSAEMLYHRPVHGLLIVCLSPGDNPKSRTVDLGRGESFGFLGFEFRRVRSRRGRWMPLLLPKGKKRTTLLSKRKEIFRASESQPVGGVIEKIHPILRGWVKYFAIGHSSRCFSFIRNWVEKKIRRHLARACQRQGFGWKRWSREWLYDTLGLFSEYRVSYRCSDSAAVPIE